METSFYLKAVKSAHLKELDYAPLLLTREVKLILLITFYKKILFVIPLLTQLLLSLEVLEMVGEIGLLMRVNLSIGLNLNNIKAISISVPKLSMEMSNE